ncbi:hypothetical protein SNOG_06661 [Parastagonospora nodorum SN15]|uniref:Uncharacterized protein n=1 Tax=Phaeosphaeria nodorum (strain SN15 / ATCC MYA-4574 / FGSC 10173) TaxID=321614 RepID=Q0UNK3_PHANO|nr:hypothetical protein SNOG_06661 [Parastagonospora nodorum SN15]EAT86492.1 hypothetical protein SNOG_06661 [Parastagonospora nodorum SN15]
MPKIVRLTLLKITDDEAIQEAVQKYSTLTQDAKRPWRQHGFDSRSGNMPIRR